MIQFTRAIITMSLYVYPRSTRVYACLFISFIRFKPTFFSLYKDIHSLICLFALINDLLLFKAERNFSGTNYLSIH